MKGYIVGMDTKWGKENLSWFTVHEVTQITSHESPPLNELVQIHEVQESSLRPFS